jgi:hypothetical protein
LRIGKRQSQWSHAVQFNHHHTCVRCKQKSNTSHHRVSWKLYPRYRFDVRCGVALCEKCHIFIHSEAGTTLREAIAKDFIKSVRLEDTGKYFVEDK